MTGRGGQFILPALLLAGAVLFASLGVWQIERRTWKLDLIERVNARATARPVELPPPAAWAALDPRDFEYRQVVARGRYLHDRETLVDALTERGPGFWVLTPLRTSRGTVLVNRGFVPPERKRPKSRPAGLSSGDVEVVGLVRLSERGGRILRPNRPAEGLWYSRDVAAIARARGLGVITPVFIDAGPAAVPGGYPIGGMTVLRFRNAHLAYALTWFALAALCVFGLALVYRSRRPCV